MTYRETLAHGTPDFPVDYQYVNGMHPRYDMPLHWHPEHEIVLVTKGRLILEADGEKYSLSQGDMMFYSGGTMHRAKAEDCIYECLIFSPQKMIESGCRVGKQLSEVCIGRRSVRGKAYSYFSKVFTLMRKGESGDSISILGNILCGVASLGEPNDGEGSSKKLLPMKRAIALIAERYSEKITLSDMARAAEMSEGYFCRYFLKTAHMTPVEYLNSYRISRAAEMLAATDKTVLEISIDSGFASLSYFIKIFGKINGITPTEYRKRQLYRREK